ncbi:MAG TPA: DUF6164 family protein [Pseudoxanthomonas sp.]|nr:DUF6164 family protein [Pseudoxanthomonas sp.]
MSKLLLNLRNVPDDEADEADEVREWLARENIAFYETTPSPWGISAGGIWISDDAQIARAKALMADYQAGRRERAHAAQAAARADGSAETFGGLLRQRPGYVLSMLAAIVAIVALTLALPYLFLR